MDTAHLLTLAGDWFSSVLHLHLQNLAWEPNHPGFGSGFAATTSRRILLLRQSVLPSARGTHSLHPNSKSALQLVQLRTLIPPEERRSYPALARAPSAPNSMDEVFRHFGQIVVDDVGDVLHMNPSRREIGCDQDA